ncbi:MAG: hypothetical protein ABI912_01490 [Actinomycetota bacterium]
MVTTGDETHPDTRSDRNVTKELARITADGTDARGFASVVRALAGSAKTAGAAAVTSGKWLVDLAIDLAGQLPVRSMDQLRADFPDRSAEKIADELVAQAAKATGAVGAVAGGLAAAEWFAPPTWVAAPIELVTETLAIAAIEMRLIGELHSVYGRPVQAAGGARAAALAHAWSTGHAVEPEYLVAGPTAAALWTAAGKRQMQRALRKRLARRAGRSAASFLPFLLGAAAGMKLNSAATGKLAQTVRRQLTR